MSKPWISSWKVLDFPPSKRQPWEEPDRLALLHFGHQWWSNVIDLEEWKKHRLSSLIREGQFEKFTDLVAMKSKFKDESESYYKEAIEKYGVNESID